MTSPDPRDPTGTTLHRPDGQPRQLEVHLGAQWLPGTATPSPLGGDHTALSITLLTGQAVTLLPVGASVRARTADPNPRDTPLEIRAALDGLVCAEDWNEDDLKDFAPMTTAMRDFLAATSRHGGDHRAASEAEEAIMRAQHTLHFEDSWGDLCRCVCGKPLLRGQRIRVMLGAHPLLGTAVGWPLDPDTVALSIPTPTGQAVMLLPEDTPVHDETGPLVRANALQHLVEAVDDLLDTVGWRSTRPPERDPMAKIIRVLLTVTAERPTNSRALEEARGTAQQALLLVDPVLT